MNTRNLILRLAGVSLVSVAASVAAVACSGDNSNGNPAPTQNDSGTTDSTTSGDDSSTGDDSSMGTDSSTGTDSGGGMDVVLIDTGSCVSDAATCNSCYNATQAAQDPYNACTPYTVNCTPFDNTRITGLSSDGGVPLVP